MRSRYRTASGSDRPLWVRSRLDCFNTTRCRRTIHKQAGRLRTQDRLQTQTRIINHYGLDLTNPEAQGFLLDNMKGFFYGASDLAQIDTSKEGSIKW